MKITEIIEKVKENLLIQGELKEELENADAGRQITEEKISVAKQNLADAEIEFEEFKENIKSDIAEETERLNNYLKSYVVSVNENAINYGVGLLFMNKAYDLLIEDEALSSTFADIDDYNVSMYSLSASLFEKYLEKGDVIFNKANIKKLKDIVALYSKNEEVVKNKLANIIVKEKIEKLNAILQKDVDELIIKNEELQTLDGKIEKSIEFKSDLLKKVFTRKQKLQEKRGVLASACENLKTKIAETKHQIADKTTLRKEANSIVEIEIASLLGTMAWIDNFANRKRKLKNFKEERIDNVYAQIGKLEESLANSQTRVTEIKGNLQLSKKITNEIVINALMNKEFVEGFNGLDLTKVSKDNMSAIKLIEGKYNEYIQGRVEDLIK